MRGLTLSPDPVSPIILAYPDAFIYEFSEEGIEPVNYRDSQPYQVTSRFLKNPEGMVGKLLGD
jgi:predicted ATPase